MALFTHLWVSVARTLVKFVPGMCEYRLLSDTNSHFMMSRPWLCSFHPRAKMAGRFPQYDIIYPCSISEVQAEQSSSKPREHTGVSYSQWRGKFSRSVNPSPHRVRPTNQDAAFNLTDPVYVFREIHSTAADFRSSYLNGYGSSLSQTRT